MGKIDWDSLGFEIKPAEKMFIAEYKNGKWDEGRTLPYGTIPIYPSSVVLNYGQGLFEGMKAYHMKDGSIVMFRPRDNARRLIAGCKRLLIPPIDEEFFIRSIRDLVLENKEYIPPFGRGDLYIRPILFGSGQMLGVNPATEYTFIIYMSPVGPYFKSGFSGVRISITDEYHRAPLCGTGGVKAIGNYATSLLPRILAKENGFDEVLYLDSKESTFVEEVGSANFFMINDGVLSTPRLAGSILPGITRESVLQIAKDGFGMKVRERDIRYDELFDADELFCTGTATVITPILEVSCGEKTYTIGDGKPGPTSKRMYEELKGIQTGEKKDPYGWVYTVE
jgi:branched-chain amino acid aminotransferase